MTRSSWVFDPNKKTLVPKHEFHAEPARQAGYVVLGDLPDFVSPIDGKAYSGRAGLREHNLRHSVVPVADLAGLPPLMTNSDTRSTQEKRQDAAARKEQIIQQVNRHYR
jgi:hypothetical protein